MRYPVRPAPILEEHREGERIVAGIAEFHGVLSGNARAERYREVRDAAIEEQLLFVRTDTESVRIGIAGGVVMAAAGATRQVRSSAGSNLDAIPLDVAVPHLGQRDLWRRQDFGCLGVTTR